MGSPWSDPYSSRGEEHEGWWTGTGWRQPDYDPGYGYTGGPWPEQSQPGGPVSPASGGPGQPGGPGSQVRPEGGSGDQYAPHDPHDPHDPYGPYGPYGPYATGARPAVGGRPAGARDRLPAAGRPGEPDAPPWAAVLTWTIGCFVVPVLLYLGWAATRSGTPPQDCLDPGSGRCPSPRDEAMAGLVDAAPSLVAALLIASLVAAALRRWAVTWRAGTIAVSAAVIGAGLATMVARALG